MSGGAARPTARRLPALAAALCLLCAAPARAAVWSDVLGASSDTVVFIGLRGELVRAPFSLASRETLWTPEGEERLARLSVSPDGRRLAWLVRESDRSPTTLWAWDETGTRRLAAYAALVPSDYGTLRFEPQMPSVDDPVIEGARLLAPSTASRGHCSNAIEWSADGREVFMGYHDGLAVAPVDSGRARVLSPMLTMGLRRLDPAPMLMAEVIRLGESKAGDLLEGSASLDRDATGRPRGEEERPGERSNNARVSAQAGTYLLYPVGHEMRVFRAADFSPGDLWTASPGTVWSVESKRRLRAVRANDPRGTLEAESDAPIVWLEYDASHSALLRASGRGIVRRPEAGAPEARVLATGSTIEAVLAPREAAVRGVVTRDSLILWDPGTGVARAMALGGVSPRGLVALAGGVLIAVDPGGHGGAPRLYRVDGGALAALDGPEVRGGTVARCPGGGALLLYAPGAHPAATLHVFDAASAAWSEVANPGIIGWEPFSPR